jgi:2-oxoglutarate ferredoxin oxidoreductase subunit gamma
MIEEIIIAGSGGQGVLSMGQLLAYSGMYDNKQVSWIPSYGIEMRGGTANCSVIISDERISSPIIAEPTTLIALNRLSLEKFQKNVVSNGLILMNSSLIDVKPSRNDVRSLDIPIDQISMDNYGNSRVANMILLGAFLEITHIVSIDSVVGALKKVLPEHRQNLIPLNKQAIELGIGIAKKSLAAI